MQNVQTGLAEDPTLSIENVLDLFNEDTMSLDRDGGMISRKPVSDVVIKTLSVNLLKEENS